MGLQWGDEGKGKIIDLISPNFDYVVRFNGGANAGHTVYANGKKFVFHILPSAALHKRPILVIANGVVVDIDELRQEIDNLKRQGIHLTNRLFISERAHLVMPYHKLFDSLAEYHSNSKIGTTQRGIGPSYSDKSARRGFRITDLFAPFFRDKLEEIIEEKNKILKCLFGAKPLDAARIFITCKKWRKAIEPYITDTALLLNNAIADNKNVLFETAQGALLDLDFGTYPYVTSSNSTACGIFQGAGIPPSEISTLGVVKAYSTRVGEGPFFTELVGEEGEFLRKKGDEFGSTTYRPRRCGWLDLVGVKYAAMISGVKSLAITKLDVLSGLKKIKICVAYKLGKRVISAPPSRVDEISRCLPVYETFEGWESDISSCQNKSLFPKNLKVYLNFIEKFLGIPIKIISTGSDRTSTFIDGRRYQ